MRRTEIEVGKRYLTRDVTAKGILGDYRTRGEVKVLVDNGRRYYVQWFMRDGSVRKTRGLPRWLPARDFLVEIPNA
jgi:hypothetical protein